MTSTAQKRPTRVIVCTAIQPEIVSLSSDVEYYYRVETDTEAATNETLDSDVPLWVSGATIDSVAAVVCNAGPRQEEGEGGGLRHRRLESFTGTSSCILSVSSGTDDSRLEDACKPQSKNSKNCSLYHGTLRILHTEVCSPQEVKSNALSVLMASMQSDEFLSAVQRSASGDGVAVTHVAFVEKDSPHGVTGVSEQDTQRSQQRDKLNAVGISMVIFAGLVLATAVLFLLAWRRRNRRDLAAPKRSEEDPAIDSDLKSIRTARTDGTTSFVEPNWRDLSASHNSMDSHDDLCKSPLCKVCHRTHSSKVSVEPAPSQPLQNQGLCAVIESDEDDSVGLNKEETEDVGRDTSLLSVSAGNGSLMGADAESSFLSSHQIGFVRQVTPKRSFEGSSISSSSASVQL